jgi:myo-inositol 2-dehydrogenase / D-chiro-inositol 1-dehydrogenase
MQYFVNCALGKEQPVETGEDGRVVLKIILAAYQSAGGGRKIEGPYEIPKWARGQPPIVLWKPELKTSRGVTAHNMETA